MRDQHIIAEREMQRLKVSEGNRLADEAKAFQAEREATLQQLRMQMDAEREELRRQAVEEFEKQKVAFERKAAMKIVTCWHNFSGNARL